MFFDKAEIDKQNSTHAKCLVVIMGIVYDLIAYDHPGGSAALIRYAYEVDVFLNGIFQDHNHPGITVERAGRLLKRYERGFFKDINYPQYSYSQVGAENSINVINGTEKRTRTSTELPPLAPEASVSTNSTISACGVR
jgi:hypothetical protein